MGEWGMSSEFIQPAEAAEIMGLTVGALARLRSDDRGPRFYKPTARTVLYKREEVIAWLEATVHAMSGITA
ncbi:helix-turn-helix transcriptional regulator [Gryllotalpicola protaetiae]|uniref:DNA-binding protein n=1 Tax=Gryllotalpicola protaetiae TaxID=2419771 RepID=A0A387BS41_9MICO|nr:hypothetical protein [Gryllotalpicola protaetiae]AYG03870.1 hypothetical protein D7I44_10205 [Gryllotalpicola protaetiae]